MSHNEDRDQEKEEQHATHWLVYGVTKDGDNMVNDQEYIAQTLDEANKEYNKLCEDGYDYVYLDSMEWDDGEWCQDCVECSTLLQNGTRLHPTGGVWDLSKPE
tara:strand:- start:46 stop:354 length:309 start_codon:yes stop_codon:yes gene_type:complete